MSHHVFIPQLQRLLQPGRFGDRHVYDSLVIDVVDSNNPLELFKSSQQRSGIFLIEALYRTHAEQAVAGDPVMASSLAALGYSRWVAWRCFRDSRRRGSGGYGPHLSVYVQRSRDDVREHVRCGWRPAANHGDDELAALLGDS